MKFSMVNMNFKEIKENKQGTIGDTPLPKTLHASSQLEWGVTYNSYNTFMKADRTRHYHQGKFIFLLIFYVYQNIKLCVSQLDYNKKKRFKI
jgi:hypothetical protein